MGDNQIIESNLDDVFEDELDDIEKSIDSITPSIDFKKKDIDFINSMEAEKPKYIRIPWQTYRMGSFIIVLLSIFLLQIFYNLLEKKYPDPYILKVYKIVSFFLLLNLASFFFLCHVSINF